MKALDGLVQGVVFPGGTLSSHMNIDEGIIRVSPFYFSPMWFKYSPNLPWN